MWRPTEYEANERSADASYGPGKFGSSGHRMLTLFELKYAGSVRVDLSTRTRSAPSDPECAPGVDPDDVAR